MDEILLLSGGIDSACIAFERRPATSIFVDYGQRGHEAERRAAAAVARELGLKHVELGIDLRSIGGGLLSGAPPLGGSPSPEWWPFRNQLLATFAASWACAQTPALLSPGTRRILIGCVRGDGERHVDGSANFVQQLNELLSSQEGALGLVAPAISRSTEELLAESRVPDSILGWTHSCHRGDVPCGNCPGCFKRERVLENTGRLR